MNRTSNHSNRPTRAQCIATARRAYTLLEMLLVVAVIAFVGALVIPAMSDTNRVHVIAASNLFASDLEYAQALNIADPRVPIIVIIDEANASYRLARADDPDTTIVRPDTNEEYAVTFGVGRARSAEGVSISLPVDADDMILFDGLGTLANVSENLKVRLQCGDRWIDIIISASTGIIRTVSDID